jgi:hypothetical protein
LKDGVGSVAGVPEIAHPNDSERYERQMAFVIGWFLEMWERMSLTDDKPGQPGHEARCELQTLLLNTIDQVSRVARSKKNSSVKLWAVELLAIIGVGARKHHKKLKTNAAYAEMEKKLSGKSVTAALLPKGRVQWIVQRELEKAQDYRKQLLLLSVIDNRKIPEAERRRFGLLKDWREAAAKHNKIPEEYWPLRKFPDFSEKSEPQWWGFLWPRIQKKIDVVKLDSHYKLTRKRYLADSDATAHDHLKLLARTESRASFF